MPVRGPATVPVRGPAPTMPIRGPAPAVFDGTNKGFSLGLPVARGPQVLGQSMMPVRGVLPIRPAAPKSQERVEETKAPGKVFMDE